MLNVIDNNEHGNIDAIDVSKVDIYKINSNLKPVVTSAADARSGIAAELEQVHSQPSNAIIEVQSQGESTVDSNVKFEPKISSQPKVGFFAKISNFFKKLFGKK
jgi:hypothetical protein